MQNEPNFEKAQMNVTSLITRDYENNSNWTLGQNKPNTNPIKPNLLNAQMNVNKVLTRDYENKSNWALFENKANTNPIQTQFQRQKMLLRLTINGRRKSMLDARFWCRQAALEAATCPFTPVVRRIFAGFGHIFLFIFIAHG